MQWKKMLFALVPAMVILSVAYATNTLKSKEIQQNEIKRQAYFEQSESLKESIGKQVPESMRSEAPNSLTGTITEVYETQDPNTLILDFEADVVNKENMSNVKREGNKAEDVEIGTTLKQYKIIVNNQVPIENSAFDDLSQDDFATITVSGDIYTDANKFTATNIEVL